MSLINDALKKAQKQREGSTTDLGADLAPHASGATTPSSPAAKNNTLPMIAGAAVIVALSVAATVYLLRDGQRESTPLSGAATPPAPAPVSASNGAPPPLPSATSPAPPPASAPATPVAASSGPSNTSAVPPVTVSLQPAPVAAQSSPPSTSSEAVSLPESAPRATPEADLLKTTNRIQGLIDKFKISGIRLADADSKVLLNDHLFRVNDLVEPSLGLRITKIESHVLTFTDADGNSYLKHF